jgi:hypothetical protein
MIENGEALKHRDGKFVFEMVKNINVVFGKLVKGIARKRSEKPPKDMPFKKQSIFYRYLPYWKEFEIGHAIDILHVEKGIFESTIGLLLNIPSKTKDGLSAHKDLQALEIREELHPQERPNGRAYLPPTSYTLTTKEKRAICKCLHRIRVPTWFLTNIKNMVSMSELKMSGYNTHDCHTMLSLFLDIAIRAVNHPYLKMVITRMCHFFNAISNKVIDFSELDEIHKEIRVTMCQLEMCFPPSFFDTMEHYMIHLAYQIFVLGPSYMHYMYPYERKRHMVVMKCYVHNRAHPEGSMIEGYTTEEVIECYVDYIKDGKPIGVPVSWHHGTLSRKGTKAAKSIIDATYEIVHEADFSVMHQLAVMRSYVEKHLQELREKNQDEVLIMKQHKLHFTTWLKDLNLPVGETGEEKMIRLLTSGPHSLVKSWQVYDINGCTFYTKAKDSRSQCQNSGVRVNAEDSTGPKNAYYGYIEEI